MLAIAPDGSFTAAPDASTVIHRSRGAITEHRSLSARSIAVSPAHAAMLSDDGAISTLSHERRHRWSIDAPPSSAPCAVSPCATHVFNGERLLSRSPRDGTITAREPFTRDFFERFTRAEFIAPALLALCYETGQPWSEFGSYGDRMKNVQIYSVGPAFETAFYWWDTRRWDEDFEPTAFAYATPPRFAVYDEGALQIIEARELRADSNGMPERTDDASEHWIYSPALSRIVWHPTALLVAGRADDGVSIFDPINERRARLAIHHNAFDFHGPFLRWLDLDSRSIAHAALTELDWVGMYD